MKNQFRVVVAVFALAGLANLSLAADRPIYQKPYRDGWSLVMTKTTLPDSLGLKALITPKYHHGCDGICQIEFTLQKAGMVVPLWIRRYVINDESKGDIAVLDALITPYDSIVVVMVEPRSEIMIVTLNLAGSSQATWLSGPSWRPIAVALENRPGDISALIALDEKAVRLTVDVTYNRYGGTKTRFVQKQIAGQEWDRVADSATRPMR